MKRIAIWGYFSGYGGIERMVFNIYKNIDRKKVQYDFLVPHNCGEIAFEREIIKMGGRVFRILYSERESVIKARTCWINYFRKHPEVKGVHIHANFPYVFPIKMAKKMGLKIRIIHSHNSSVKNKPNTLFQKIRNYNIMKDIETLPTEKVACGDKAGKFMFGDSAYVWIKNGINIEDFKYNKTVRDSIREKYGIKDDDIVIGQIGHLTDIKQPLFSLCVLKEILKKRNNIKMIFAGDGPLKGEMEDFIANNNMKDNVIMLGTILNVSELYNALDILVLPSKYEGFPVVLVEAQTSGVKCIMSDRVTKQSIQSDLCKRISLNDKKMWEREILNVKLPKSRIEYARVMYDAGFDIKSTAQEVEKLYR